VKAQVYKDPRDPSYFTRFHERARSRRPDWVYTLVRVILTPYLLIVHRARALATIHVPEAGPVIIAPNHFSFLDHFFVAVYLRRKVHFMAKSQLFARPMQFIYTHGGVFPVRRGFADEEAFKTAHTILDRGDIVLMYPEGGRSRSGDLGEPKRGIGKIALESGVPVVPVAIHGSAHVRGWKRFRFPKVTIQYGEPVTFPVKADPSRDDQQQVANQVFDRVRAMYVDLERNGRRDVLKRLREGLPAATPSPDPSRLN
jgi:1-acyl-sn-glycerol-3-phosphate acyltransferase